MIVRQSDAHAAEALIAGEWRRFDPTGRPCLRESKSDWAAHAHG
jgi:hypothetical protein